MTRDEACERAIAAVREYAEILAANGEDGFAQDVYWTGVVLNRTRTPATIEKLDAELLERAHAV